MNLPRTPSPGAPCTPDDAGPDDAASIAARYARRRAADPRRDDASRPEVQHWLHERRAGLARMLARAGWGDCGARRAVEVGCGAGGNLGLLIDAGFASRHLIGIDLLGERIEAARAVLPADVMLEVGDAAHAAIVPGSVDLVLQFTVFSSLLHDETRRALADAMWRWLAPGGAVLSYDFVVTAPHAAGHASTRGCTRALGLRDLRALFPQGVVRHVDRVTLAPPLARAAARVHPRLIGALDALPWLRSHRLVWIEKPA